MAQLDSLAAITGATMFVSQACYIGISSCNINKPTINDDWILLMKKLYLKAWVDNHWNIRIHGIFLAHSIKLALSIIAFILYIFQYFYSSLSKRNSNTTYKEGHTIL